MILKTLFCLIVLRHLFVIDYYTTDGLYVNFGLLCL